jgi:quercetin dioxygenase-like cupin family protein
MIGCIPGDAMNPQTFADFENAARAQGFDEVLLREWEPGQVSGNHTHPFDLSVLVVRGGLVLNCGGEARTLGAGQRFELPRDTEHSEHYGPEGATFWVARRR